MAQSKKKFTFSRRLQMVAFGVVLIVFVGGGYYAVTQFEESNAEQEGIITCGDDFCEKSVHIHADLSVSACGEEIDIPKNSGSVTEQHTHSEENYMHIHVTYAVDPDTYEVLESELPRLYIKNFFENIEIPFSSSPATLGNYTEGDTCPDGSVLAPEDLTLTVTNKEGVTSVNPTMPIEHYIWQDGDDITITFGN